jgi:phosphatidylglycerophosphate synthase
MASSKGINIPASPFGKIKMILETVTICFLLLGEKNLGSLYSLSRLGLWLAIVAALISAAQYYVKFGRTVLSGRT